MSRTSTLQKVETFLIVTLIALLVWLYADAQTVKKFTRVPVQIKLVPPPNEQLAIDPITVRRVGVTFRASSSQKMQFDRLSSPLEVYIDASANGGSPTRTMDVAALLQHSELGELGISIEETDPPDMQVRVESLEEVELPVETFQGDLGLTDVVPGDPPRVRVMMPQSLVEPARSAHVVADLTQVDLEGLEEGVPQTRTVTLTLSPALKEQADPFSLAHTSIEPAQIEVTFTIRNQQKTIKVDLIPIELSALPTLWRHFQLNVSDDQLVLSGVELTGPSDEIDKIESGETKVRAYIRPTAEELGDGVVTFTPRLDLPPRVTHSPLSPVTLEVTPLLP